MANLRLIQGGINVPASISAVHNLTTEAVVEPKCELVRGEEIENHARRNNHRVAFITAMLAVFGTCFIWLGVEIPQSWGFVILLVGCLIVFAAFPVAEIIRVLRWEDPVADDYDC